ISRGKQLHQGTWLLAASPAALCISRPTHSFAARVLTVSIGDVVYEEHYVSILNFSWPQVACVTECPVRGSRVVFVSFCDRSKQVQKFAVRFPRLSDAESFLNSVKELSSNTMDIMPSGSDYIPSNGLQYRPDEAVSFEEPTSDHRTDAPAVGYHMEPDQPVLQSPIATNINSIYSGFPEGYSGFPEGYSGFAEGYSGSVKIERDGGPFPATITDHAPEKVMLGYL
uniref:Poor homologous synapsis 1 PH domain-containing protein n=2 Tax=Aegilops tauschii subsp. strangulata TaxID=200361 RepID=A0A453RH80_AEGTS